MGLNFSPSARFSSGTESLFVINPSAGAMIFSTVTVQYKKGFFSKQKKEGFFGDLPQTNKKGGFFPLSFNFL